MEQPTREAGTDVGRVVEDTQRALDAWVTKAGYVEVDLVVGEEPEEGVEVGVSSRPADFGAARLLVRADGTEEPLRYHQYGVFIDTAKRVKTVEQLDADGVICVPVGGGYHRAGLPEPPKLIKVECACAGLPPTELCAACQAALSAMGQMQREHPVCDETQCGFHHEPTDPACVRARYRGRR